MVYNCEKLMGVVVFTKVCGLARILTGYQILAGI